MAHLDEGAAGAVVWVVQQIGDVEDRRRGDTAPLELRRELAVVV